MLAVSRLLLILAVSGCGRLGFDNTPAAGDAGPDTSASDGSIDGNPALERWVSEDGSDSATGTRQDPWRTLQFAADQVSAGMRVFVEPGTYQGFTVSASGTTEADQILFESILAGAAIVTSTITLAGADFVKISGFTVRPFAGDGIFLMAGATPSIGNFIFNNRIENAPGDGIDMRGTEYVVLFANTVTSPGETGIQLAPVGGSVDVRSNVVTASVSAGIFASATSEPADIFVTGNRIVGSMTNGIHVLDHALIASNNVLTGAPIFVNSSRPQTFYNNTVKLLLADSAMRLNGTPAGIVLFNNALTGPAGTAAVSTQNALPLEIDVANNGVTDSFEVDGLEMGLDGWEVASGSSGHFVLDPEDLDDDGSPANDAPTIDSGLEEFAEISAPTDDIAGTPRPQGAAIDVGAYEL